MTAARWVAVVRFGARTPGFQAIYHGCESPAGRRPATRGSSTAEGPLALSDAATLALIAYPTDSRGVDDVPDGGHRAAQCCSR